LVSELPTILKSTVSLKGMDSQSSARITAAGGGEDSRRSTNDSRDRVGPKASMVTPEESLRTVPTIPSSRASR
jgi:hypothetical protein